MSVTSDSQNCKEIGLGQKGIDSPESKLIAGSSLQAKKYLQPDSSSNSELSVSLTLSSQDQKDTAFIKLAAEKSCKGCGGDLASLAPGKGPHSGSLQCAGCGRFLQWIGKRKLKIAIQQLDSARLAQGGTPHE